MGYVLGIDLGTTYSAAAVAEGDRVDIVQLGSRAATIPSIVVLRDDGEILVGDAAERRAGSEPARAAREFKRRLGDPTPMIVGGSPFGAEALMAQVLRAIVKQVSDERGEPPSLIAVTHPASYGDYKLDLLRQMVRQAEAGEAVFIPEPVAAAVHYASQERIEPGSTVAVYDFGGGTFDAAVLRKTDAGSFEILGRPEGLERLGGIDFDEAVFSHVAETLGRAALEGDGGATARAAIGRLREECRDAKESLSADTEATIPVLLPAIQTEVRLTRAELEDIVRPRVRETAAALDRSVRSAGLEIGDIDRILLVGGSSRIPLVGQVLREMTGRPISRDAHPKHAIALGAARFALDHGVPVAVPSPTSAKAEPGACDRAGLARRAACDSAGAGSPSGGSRQHRWAFNRLTGSRSRRSKGAGHRCASPRPIRRRGRRESSERGSTPVAPCRRRRARRGRGSRRCSGVRARWRRERKRRGEDHERPGLRRRLPGLVRNQRVCAVGGGGQGALLLEHAVAVGPVSARRLLGCESRGRGCDQRPAGKCDPALRRGR